MRTLPQGLIDKIESGSARLCHVWLLTRTDGVRMGFSDHDCDLVVDGVRCLAASGWTAGATDAGLGFSTGTLAASGGLNSGVLDSAALTEADIRLGLYDQCAIVLRRVDWSQPDLSVAIWQGVMARLVREGARFTAEIEGPLAVLDRVVGRTYGRLCDANLGDGRCRVPTADIAYTGQATILLAMGRKLVVSGLSNYRSGWFSGGLLTPLGGPALMVADHGVQEGGAAVLTLQTVPSAALMALLVLGRACTVQVGCDKSVGKCADKFANILNFQGFPHIPGDDFLSVYPAEGEPNDGGSRRS